MSTVRMIWWARTTSDADGHREKCGHPFLALHLLWVSTSPTQQEQAGQECADSPAKEKTQNEDKKRKGHGRNGAHSAQFADQLVAGLPPGFTGVLDINSSMPFAALTMRSLYNERKDFLLATFPVAHMTLPAPAPIIFPQIADGGGYVTQFILIGAGGASNVALNFCGEDGNVLPVRK